MVRCTVRRTVPHRTVHVLLLLMGWAATVWGFPCSCSGLDFLFFLSRETSVFLTGQACFGLLFISSLAASVAFLAQQSRSLIASQLVISPYLRLRSTFFFIGLSDVSGSRRPYLARVLTMQHLVVAAKCGMLLWCLGVFGWLQADTVVAVWTAAAAIHREKNTVEAAAAAGLQPQQAAANKLFD